jgi:hypothetical protein
VTPLRYLLDENVDPVYAREMIRRDPSFVVWRIGAPGAPLKGTLDPEILVWCEIHGFVLVTNNRKSMPEHLRDHLAIGRHIRGIIALNAVMSVGDALDDLWLIATVADEPEYADRILYLPL